MWHSHFPRFWPWTCPAFSIKLVDNSVFYSCYYKHEDNENILPKICIFGPQIILSQRLLIVWRFKQISTNRSYIILIGGKNFLFLTYKLLKQSHSQINQLSKDTNKRPCFQVCFVLFSGFCLTSSYPTLVFDWDEKASFTALQWITEGV